MSILTRIHASSVGSLFSVAEDIKSRISRATEELDRIVDAEKKKLLFDASLPAFPEEICQEVASANAHFSQTLYKCLEDRGQQIAAAFAPIANETSKCDEVTCHNILPAKFLQKYRLVDADDYVQKLGEGGFGSVVRCVHRRAGVHKAAKFFDSADVQGLRAWKRVEPHPNIVSLVDYFPSTSSRNGCEVAVMNLCHGVDISEWLEQNAEAVTEADASRIFKYMVRATTHVHACGVLHRDLKLENFIFSNASLDSEAMDELRLCDFDLARPIEEADECKSGATIGTPIYAAPEVLNDEACSTASDVYALGVCLFILLTLHFPYPNRTPREEPDFALLDGCSQSARDLIRGMLQADPTKRMSLHDVASHPFLAKAMSSSGSRATMRRRDSLNLIASESSKVQLQEHRLEPGMVLFREGDEGEDVFHVDKGNVEVWKGGLCIATLHPGDIVGEMALLSTHCRGATIKAGPEGASLLKLEANEARQLWEDHKGMTTLRSLAQIGSERDAFNQTFSFFKNQYPEGDDAFLLDLVQSLENEDRRRVGAAEAVLNADNMNVNQKLFYVRTGELSVYHKGELMYNVPPGSFIGKPSVMQTIGAPRGSKDIPIEIVASEEAEVVELPVLMTEWLLNKHAEAWWNFMEEATQRWVVPEGVA